MYMSFYSLPTHYLFPSATSPANLFFFPLNPSILPVVPFFFLVLLVNFRVIHQHHLLSSCNYSFSGTAPRNVSKDQKWHERWVCTFSVGKGCGWEECRRIYELGSSL
ncbi:hypothetical protein, unlikely [Trypanosoma brucei gambiense DAL972]|uniref:Uncharacterized protein n=1 Tax=Trypanosoma brucei gambiense (strain MHOM/CI/86/DAL972) TaxID=679716 RepID=C9ZRY0_TRYB9|nr:hypothetical protein, unlikely [Trypanosoma brucei gambiense DAL972]CBH12116.1 hypothetical protein, unlikely [Trypanosoma brucei gambiense DAL972]|eukprot:XP_011774399.1 hypothetical protein, unlikely [Trypanosoma brucei gambiense DAL972]